MSRSEAARAGGKVPARTPVPTAKGPATSVAEYLAAVDPEERAVLEEVRATILAAAPRATEEIRYKMPIYDLHGPLVGFAAQRNYLGFYVMSAPVVSRFAPELKGFDVGKGCIRFSSRAPLPLALVRRLVQARVVENLRAP
jgi:uncharacterized protein YdhG (YjbR/CyaY superfamily)